ncbi:MAG: ribosome maturation factor RimM [Absicoccus porci]|jgi:16S rRNA processing protein RimM|uniref:Ribosome maturation factor RimM n=1 Tax=Absicoccus porci TaxID=2486576 RepID=A0A3N0HZZ7_9FIRM|nr:ribosome maturation factor RimM [Absicoccus porci]MCI6087825.1 ribosome maturation factor RimM [Absicoccus porci]MDD6460053.1 ribosome maturation factor RimM [Absicoccus porci]MDD7330060.1 ribosome maturation factor RimM [Absicoccus porci]MDY4738922.1 ribosome maturation factor RimM [Absicoccus porci]MEE1355567.1 ribosome maturation factor RimM [Absicoccus porci]
MVKVAKIINTHGLKGECKLYLITDDVDDRFQIGRELYLADNTKMTVQSFRMQKGFGYAKFEGITTIEQAEALKTKDLFIPISELPPLPEGHYYFYELMDCDVYNTDGEALGKVLEILETGANLVLRIGTKEKNFLCAYVPTFIQSVDVNEKKIIIKEMAGLR